MGKSEEKILAIDKKNFTIALLETGHTSQKDASLFTTRRNNATSALQ